MTGDLPQLVLSSKAYRDDNKSQGCRVSGLAENLGREPI